VNSKQPVQIDDRDLLRHRPLVSNSQSHSTLLLPYNLSASIMTELQAASASALPDGITDPNYKPLPGRLGNLTVPQQHALETLKKELKAEGRFVEQRMDDSTLLRYV
jgi:hypothetical protein